LIIRLLKIIVIVLFACEWKNKDCHIDKAFKSLFESKLEIMKASEIHKIDMTINEKLKAIIFFNAITGHHARIESYHIPLYEDIETFKQDIRVWSKWYENQKCGYTKEKADSLVSAYKL